VNVIFDPADRRRYAIQLTDDPADVAVKIIANLFAQIGRSISGRPNGVNMKRHVRRGHALSWHGGITKCAV
jgi:hypothetical protein